MWPPPPRAIIIKTYECWLARPSRCLAQLHIAQARYCDTTKVPLIILCVFTHMAGHPMPCACCTQNPVCSFCFTTAALKAKALCADYKCINVRELHTKASFPADFKALPCSTSQ